MALELLGSQQDAIFVAIEEEGFGPDEFDFASGVVTHTGGSRFEFSMSSGRWVVTHSPGAETMHQRRVFGGWEPAFVQFRRWLAYLRRELTTPNFWAQLANAGTRIREGPHEATPFSPEEVAEIRHVLEEVKALVRGRFELAPQQQEVIDTRLDELAEEAPKQPRGRWRAMFIGYFVGYLMEAILPPEVAREIIVSAMRALVHMFGAEAPELPPGGGTPELPE